MDNNLILTDEETDDYCNKTCGHKVLDDGTDHCKLKDYGRCNRQDQLDKLSKMFSPKIQEAIVKIIREHFDCGILTYQGEAHKIATKIQDIFDIQIAHELDEQGKGWAEDFLEYTKAMESLKDETVKDVYKKLGAYIERVLKCSELSNEYKISALLYYAQSFKSNKEG